MQPNHRENSKRRIAETRVPQKPFVNDTHLNVIKSLATDYTVKELADLYKVDKSTLSNQINYLKAKFYCQNRTALVITALKKGIINLEDL